MAILNNRQHKMLSGTLGPIIISTRNDTTYVRSRPGKPMRPPTQRQLEQRRKFSLVSAFLRTMMPLLKVGYRQPGKKTPPFNSALSYNMQNAINGTYPTLTLAFDRVQVTRGDLPGAPGVQALTTTGNAIRFTWINNAGTGMAAGSDRSILIAHCPLLNQTIFKFSADRETGEAFLSTTVFAGQLVETWIGFISEDELEVSDSIYAGSLVV